MSGIAAKVRTLSVQDVRRISNQNDTCGITHDAFVSGEEPVKSVICALKYLETIFLKQRIESVHEGVRYQCSYCPGKFTSLKSVRRHEKVVHVEGGPGVLKCKLCGIHLNSKASLASHVGRLHRGQQRPVASSDVARLQKKTRTDKDRKIIFQCQHCPESFNEREDIRCHLSQSHGITHGDEGDKRTEGKD